MEYFITSESYIKNSTPIFDGIAGKYMESAIREAQEISVKNVIGSRLLARLKELGLAGTLTSDGNELYKELIDRLQPVMAWLVCAKLTRITSAKVTNKGVVRTSDERVDNMTFDEVIKVENSYQAKADFYTFEVQKFLLHNRASFPELTECDCAAIRANLRSSASCGLWLGGVRGKIIY